MTEEEMQQWGATLAIRIRCTGMTQTVFAEKYGIPYRTLISYMAEDAPVPNAINYSKIECGLKEDLKDE